MVQIPTDFDLDNYIIQVLVNDERIADAVYHEAARLLGLSTEFLDSNEFDDHPLNEVYYALIGSLTRDVVIKAMGIWIKPQ